MRRLWALPAWRVAPGGAAGQVHVQGSDPARVPPGQHNVGVRAGGRGVVLLGWAGRNMAGLRARAPPLAWGGRSQHAQHMLD